MDIWKELKQEGVDSGLLEEVRAFRDAHPAPPEAAGRVPRPRFLYYGKEVWEGAAAALLCGEHLLLAGPKATGKNVLAENLAAAFGRPAWDVSMYVNVDAAATSSIFPILHLSLLILEITHYIVLVDTWHFHIH